MSNIYTENLKKTCQKNGGFYSVAMKRYIFTILFSLAGFGLCAMLLNCADKAENGGGNGGGGGNQDTLPEMPQNFRAVASSREVTLRWDVQEGLTYNLFHFTRAGFSLENGMKISDIKTSPYLHTGLMDGTTYYYRLTAVNDSGESKPTREVSARTPVLDLPLTPRFFKAVASSQKVTLSWIPQQGITYNLFHSTTSGIDVGDANVMKISGIRTSPYLHTGLMDGTTYYYRLTAVNSWGESKPTDEVSAGTPALELPPTPQNFRALASSRQVTLRWEKQPGVTYDLFHSRTAGINVGSGTAAKFSGVTPPHIHKNLTNGTTYYYRLTANNRSVASAPTAELLAIPSVPEISAGEGHTCAVVSDRALCWGSGLSGKLGHKRANPNENRKTPTQVYGLTSGVTQISAGGNHTCAVVSGRAVCWGKGGFGQLGNDTESDASTPQRVMGLTSGVTDISAGGSHTCAVVDNAAFCWGANWNGQLGSDDDLEAITPQQVGNLTSGVTDISAGFSHTCAVVDNGALCWGSGERGKVGNNNASLSEPNPQEVHGLTSGVTQIIAGRKHTCAVVNGGAMCWGEGGSGQLGDNRSGNDVSAKTPQQVIGLTTGVTEIAVGEAHTCAVASGRAVCWGNNGASNARLGAGGNSNTKTPLQVAGLTTGVTQISGGDGHTCAVVNERAMCWGDGGEGRLGDGAETNRQTPVSVSDL